LINLYNVVATPQTTGDQVMTIVPIGSLIVQVPPSDTPQFAQELSAVLEKQIRQVIGRCLEEVLESEVEGWLGRKRHVRRRRTKGQRVEIRCSRCFSQERRRFRRNGHYQRRLDTRWGRVKVHVPQVVCVCGGNVRLSFRTMRRGQRIWHDLEWEAVMEYERGLSYRQIKSSWDQRLGSSVGLRTLNQRVLALDCDGLPTRPWIQGEVPPIVRLDGIWITVMFPTGKTRTDRLGRKRLVKKAKKVPILAAQGVCPVSEKTTLLAWVRADGEDTASWQRFLEQLYEAGLTPENGLALLVADGGPGLLAARENVYWTTPLQRCVFHKLRNLAQAFIWPADLDRQAGRRQRIQFLRQAARIWQAPTETEARRRCAAFSQHWQALQPKAIRTLHNDFDETLTFYALQDMAADRNEVWAAHLLRTTSPLERTFREFRRRYRLAVLFHSEAGARAVTSQLAARFS
jgi:transposase-like protein